VEAVTPGNVVAVKAHGLAIQREADPGRLAFQVVQLHIRYAIENRRGAGLAGIHQVAGDFGLAVDHHGVAAGQRLQIDPNPPLAESQFDTFVNLPLSVHALGHPRLTQQIDHTLLQYPGADAPEYVLGRLPFDDDVGDASVVQQLPQQQARRAGTDDGHTCFHGSVLTCYCRARPLAAPCRDAPMVYPRLPCGNGRSRAGIGLS